MSARHPRRQDRPAQRTRASSKAGISGGTVFLFLGVAALAVVLVAVVISRSRGEGAVTAGGLPGPIGGKDIAQDVGTMAGRPAPAFSLQDSEGKEYQVTPGRGRPLVLISHMGIT